MNCKLNSLYRLIRENGSSAMAQGPRFGGIWSQDSWIMGDLKACLQDDGYTIVVMHVSGEWSVRETGTFDPVFTGITAEKFDELATSILEG